MHASIFRLWVVSCILILTKISKIKSEYILPIYTAGLFETPKEESMKYMDAIAYSGFNVAILWTLHVTESGNLIFNNEYIAVNGYLNESYYGNHGIMPLQKHIQHLRNIPGSTIKTILFCNDFLFKS